MAKLSTKCKLYVARTLNHRCIFTSSSHSAFPYVAQHLSPANRTVRPTFPGSQSVNNRIARAWIVFAYSCPSLTPPDHN